MADNTIEKLTTLFTRFPGIGPRQARRFVYFLLKNNQQNLNDLATTIQSLKQSVVSCESCYRYFTPNGGNQNICHICLDSSRDKQVLMVLEKDSDLSTIEKTGSYTGQYFVLGGVLPVLEKNPALRIKIEELKKYIVKHKPQEIILGLSATTEGDYTEEFLRGELKTLKEKLDFTLSVLGRGLSTGSELEYLDTDTFKNALNNRKLSI